MEDFKDSSARGNPPGITQGEHGRSDPRDHPPVGSPYFHNFIDTVTDWVWEMDENGIITYSNPAVEKIVGFEEGELVGRPFYSLVPPEESDKVRELIKHHWTVRKPIERLEHGCLSRDGDIIQLETSGNPFFDAFYQSQGIRFISRNIAGRQSAPPRQEAADTAINQLVEAVAIIQPDLTISFVNDSFCALFGYTRDEILGKSLMKLEVEHKTTSFQPPDVTEALLKNNIWQGEVKRRTKSGRYIPVMISARATYDAQGELTGYIGTYLDLRPIKHSELKLKKALSATIYALAKAIENRDVLRARHQDRVADFAVAIAIEMGKDLKFIEGLTMAAMVHDIGKIYIPTEIINRAGRLTPHEMNMIKTHPTVGHEILKQTNLPWPVADIVLQHHERINGSGYPNQLKGDDIVPEAKILAVADVLETMRADRPYRPAISMENCIGEIEMNRGILYDPEVVDVSLALLKEKNYHLKPI